MKVERLSQDCREEKLQFHTFLLTEPEPDPTGGDDPGTTVPPKS